MHIRSRTNALSMNMSRLLILYMIHDVLGAGSWCEKEIPVILTRGCTVLWSDCG